jgi:hypothetical protein
MMERNLKMSNITRQQSILYLNLMFMCEVMLNSIDELKGTSLYRHAIKSKVNLLIPELEKVVEKDLAAIWGVDDNAMYQILDQQKELIKRLSVTRPETWCMLIELLDMYEADKDGFLARNQICISD